MGEFPSFVAFYSALHARDPFPWQQALAEQVTAHGWPRTVDVPTGLGKTSTMTIAVWELARQVHTGEPRTAPLRVVHIVDRTTLVDQTHADLTVLHTALHDAAAADTDGPVGTVAHTLAEAFGTPLMIGHAHGSDHDDGWVRSAAVPVVVTMTAHQAVSRMLFRGFGISPGMSPVHAGLLGVDALLLLDEPHLSTAALSTLRAATRLQHDTCSLPVPHARVVAMGATVPGGDAEAFRISEADHAHPIAGARLGAQKTLDVVFSKNLDIKSSNEKEEWEKIVKDALVKAAASKLQAHPDQSVAVVCNTVAVARAVHQELTAQVTSDALLVTSRVRAHERARMNTTLAQPELPRLLVTTQTVEAGVDLSVAIMITEVSEWTSLVQRIGRVNRYGTTAGQVVLISRPRGTAFPSTKAIYGSAAIKMATLAKRLPESVDVSPIGLQRLQEQHADLVEQASAAHLPAPTLTAEMLPTLQHTNPRPAADVDMQPFITGVPERSRVEDVTVAWRDICDPTVLDGQPPSPEETVSVPLAAVQHLLQRRLHSQNKTSTAPAMDDASSSASSDTVYWRDVTGHVAVRTGGQWAIATSQKDVTPGARILLHTDLGGHDATGWTPEAHNPVLDLSAYYRHQRGQWWLLTDTALSTLHTLGTLTEVPDLTVAEKLTEAEPDEVDALAEQLLPGELGPLQVGPASEHGLWVRAYPENKQATEVVTSDEHACHVAERATRAATTLALPEYLATTLTWGGYRHDDGKDYVAFQAHLGAAPDGEPLAKPHPRHRGIKGVLPRGWRHESSSAHRLVNERASPLLVHLVAAHHGWARPLLPAAAGPEQTLPTNDRFTALNTTWGPWGLAWLESLVRLADHQASATPEEGHAAPSTPMPRDEPDGQQTSSVDPPHEHTLAGLPADTHLHWWAALGALAAATEADPHAALRFAPQPAGPVPVLLTTVDLSAVAERVMALRTSVLRIANQHPGLAKKTEKLKADDARATLAALDEQPPVDRATAAALLDDTQIPDKNGRVEPRVPWRHGNSSLIGKVRTYEHAPEQITTALTSDTPEQHDDEKMFGLLPTGVDPAPAAGIPHTGRSVLLPLVLAATCRLPATGGRHPAGTTVDRRRVLPMPHHPVRWNEIVALLQTLPALPHRPWADCGVDSTAWRELKAPGETFGWIGD